MVDIDSSLKSLRQALGVRAESENGLYSEGPRELQAWFDVAPLPMEVPWFSDEGMRLFAAPELDQKQVGYRHSIDGERLIGWPDSWLALGAVSGDPVIARLEEEGVPVDYAVHGVGKWEAERLAPSLATFALALERWIAQAGSQSILTGEDELRADLTSVVDSELIPILGPECVPLWKGKHWLD